MGVGVMGEMPGRACFSKGCMKQKAGAQMCVHDCVFVCAHMCSHACACMHTQALVCVLHPGTQACAFFLPHWLLWLLPMMDEDEAVPSASSA